MGRRRVAAPGRGRSRGEARGGGPALQPRGGSAGRERSGFGSDGKQDGLAAEQSAALPGLCDGGEMETEDPGAWGVVGKQRRLWG